MSKLEDFVVPFLFAMLAGLGLTLVVVIIDYKNEKGTTSGQLVDVSNSGIFYTSCEIDVQYGAGASKIASFSSTDTSLCENLSGAIGSNVTVKYETSNFNFHIGTKYLIKNIELAK